MRDTSNSDFLEKKILVAAVADQTFELFTSSFNEWWPKEYTWSQQVLQFIGIEPKVGGSCYELGPNQFRLDWGKVIRFDPPNYLSFSWHIDSKRVPVPNPDQASTVEISLREADTQKTELVLVHRDFAHHGEEYSQYLEAMDSEYGWTYILAAFQKFCEKQNK